jgi:AraC-like DNA-binding protein
MILVTQGSGALLVNGQSLGYTTGDLILLFHGDSVSLSENEDSHFMYVDFSGRRAEELLLRFGISPDNRLFGDFGGMIPLWKECLLRASPETIDLAAEGVLLYTLSRMRRETSEGNETVAAMLRIVEAEFTDHALSIGTIGRRLSYHPKYLSHLFKREMGVGFSEYLRDKRINYARTLFDHGIDSVKNVALLSGFNDPLYFSGVFKRVTGLSPTQYLQGLGRPS